MRKLFEIPIRPVRIAFDHWELHEVYEKAVRIAVEAGHTSLSNFSAYENLTDDLEILNVLSYYRIRREDAERAMGKDE